MDCVLGSVQAAGLDSTANREMVAWS